MAKNKNTYGAISKWFKWSSIIIMLVPIASLILTIITVAQNGSSVEPDWFKTGQKVLAIILSVTAIIWIILNIIMFCAAGTVRDDGESPLKIRIWLLIALALVLAPVILLAIHIYAVGLGPWAYWVGVLVPIAGYIIGAIMGSKLQHNLN